MNKLRSQRRKAPGMKVRSVLLLLLCLRYASRRRNWKAFELSGNTLTYTEVIEAGRAYKPDGDGPSGSPHQPRRGGSASNTARVVAPEMVKSGVVCIAVDYTHGIDGNNIDPGASAENIRRCQEGAGGPAEPGDVDEVALAAFGHKAGGFSTPPAADPDAKIKAAIVSAGGISPMRVMLHSRQA